MKTQFTYSALLAFALTSLVACSKGGGTSSETSSTAATISAAYYPTAVVASGSTTISPTGGTAPYYFRLSSGGTLSATSGTSTVFTMDSAGDMGVVYITDSVGLSTEVVITSSSTTSTTSATTTGLCQGTYNLNLAGTAGTLTIISDTAGDIAGNINIAGGVAAIQGTCLNGVVKFLNQFSGSSYSGTYSINSSTAQIWMQGNLTDVYGNVSTWYAISQ